MQDETVSKLLYDAREHHRAGQLEVAEALYRRAAELAPANVDARLNLGMVLIDLARLVEATDILGQLVVDDPKFAAGWMQLARAIAPQGFEWEAHDALSKALRAKPDADTLVAASMMQMSLEHLKAAESSARRAVEMAPQSVGAWLQLGQVLFVRNRRDDATDAYRRALANDPGNAVAEYFLAALGDRPTPKTAPPQYVRALFDGFAQRFDGTLVGQLKYRTPQLMQAMFNRWLQRPGAGAVQPLSMLDAGCGTGLCADWLTKYRGHLIGVDLSRRMLAEAQERGGYDELIGGEVVEELKKRPNRFDLIVAADVLVYFGDLSRIVAAAESALKPGGVFLFSVEATADADYLLRPTQQFAHSLPYLQRLAAAGGFAVQLTEDAVLRQEKGADVHGYLVLAEKANSG